MSAESKRLRQAARLLRRRAIKSSTGGEWEAFRAHTRSGKDTIGVCDQTDDVSIYEDSHSRECDAEYIAMMHPAVALALADSLAATADMAENNDGTWRFDLALAVADAILAGGAS